VIEIGNRLVLLVGLRPRCLPGEIDSSAPAFGEPDAHGYVGESPAAWKLRSELVFVGPRPGHVLLLGSTGTGKELAAGALHALARREGPLVARNAATFPDSLVDAELFGNLKGYPNPGMSERKGLIGAADGGSLFLDEFGDLAIEAQAHLLRVLDAGEYQRLGESTARHADLRLIGATNRPETALRPDILARFDFRVRTPDLSQRLEDIPFIVRHLLRSMTADDAALRARVFGESAWPHLSGTFVRRLVQHRFTANVRELRSILWRSLQKGTGELLEWPGDDSVAAPEPSAGEIGRLKQELAGAERRRIEDALEQSGGNQTRAAKLLGMSRRTLVSRLKELGMQRNRSR
jgi:DNA-binding NtrC family response regulator